MLLHLIKHFQKMMDKNLHSLEQNFTSWTDDVPTCKDSGNLSHYIIMESKSYKISSGLSQQFYQSHKLWWLLFYQNQWIIGS